MKICFLNKDLDAIRKGGGGRYGRDIVENILKQNDIKAVVLTEIKSNYKLEKPILRQSYLLRNLPNLFINAFKIRKYVRDCDIIHALDGYPYAVIAALANIGLNKKLIINGIGTFSILPLDKPIKKFLMKWAYKKADKILCISTFTEKQLLKRIKLKNIIVINHGVDYEKFNRDRYIQIRPRRVGNTQIPVDNQRLSARPKVVLSVGALKPRKGYHISISAIAEVKKKYKDIKYYIVGKKPPQMYLDLVKKYNLGKNVEFLYNLSDEDLIKLYHQCDIFLLTPITFNDNDFEGFGLVYLEAGACGKPVIGTYNCGAEDAIENNVTGLLVSQQDVKKTAEAITKLLNNPELAKKMGKNGKKRAREMNWGNIVKKYIEVYKNL